jgi:CheY-like chemotaxis protein
MKPGRLTNSNNQAKMSLENHMIMLVEDNHRLRKVAARTLKRLGMQVIEAETADEALIKLDEVSVCDILFSDIQLPGKLNGRQLSILAKDKYPKIKVLLTSGYEESRAQNGDVEINGEVLKKPYTKADLERALTAIFDN